MRKDRFSGRQHVNNLVAAVNLHQEARRACLSENLCITVVAKALGAPVGAFFLQERGNRGPLSVRTTLGKAKVVTGKTLVLNPIEQEDASDLGRVIGGIRETVASNSPWVEKRYRQVGVLIHAKPNNGSVLGHAALISHQPLTRDIRRRAKKARGRRGRGGSVGGWHIVVDVQDRRTVMALSDQELTKRIIGLQEEGNQVSFTPLYKKKPRRR